MTWGLRHGDVIAICAGCEQLAEQGKSKKVSKFYSKCPICAYTGLKHGKGVVHVTRARWRGGQSSWLTTTGSRVQTRLNVFADLLFKLFEFVWIVRAEEFVCFRHLPKSSGSFHAFLAGFWKRFGACSWQLNLQRGPMHARPQVCSHSTFWT